MERHHIVNRNNPCNEKFNIESPLSVGNGRFAFTTDITGMQTLYKEQIDHNIPLCTLSEWGWHTKPTKDNGVYTLDDLQMTMYQSKGKEVSYPVKKTRENEEIYDWLRENPHRFNLARISFYWNKREIEKDDISMIHQELDLYKGILTSKFSIYNHLVSVETLCASNQDTLGFFITSEALKTKELSVMITFPYGSSNMAASDWNNKEAHTTKIINQSLNTATVMRCMDESQYYVNIVNENSGNIQQTGTHEITVTTDDEIQCFTCQFSQENSFNPLKYSSLKIECENAWKKFWEEGGMVDLSKSKDVRAKELERRIILSLYLTRIQSCGSYPPAETGLTCNSWFGKFHLEMYLWHCAFYPLWGRAYLIEPVLNWYKKVLPKAIQNASRNGYKGARWPKMVATEANDSPSNIAPLLIWQQPHIIFILELYYKATGNEKVLQDYWEVIKQTADFMCDFVEYDDSTKRYSLPSPLIPAQERFDPVTTKNPTFELEYWSFGLELANKWGTRLNKKNSQWNYVSTHMKQLPTSEGLYLSCEDCEDTFVKYNEDHPSMLGVYGLLPGYHADPDIVSRTLNKVMECWRFDTMWGWDFAMMAMTLFRLDRFDEAMDILLKDTPKNTYVTSGNNCQRTRKDLPLYLPGNGSLLLAIALLVSIENNNKGNLNVLTKGRWNIEAEGMISFPC